MDVPLKCISFSPNWFYPQIVQMNDSLLCYGANEQVFVFNSQSKNFKYILQGLHKVTLLYLRDNLIFIGQEGGIITIFEEQKYLGKLELNIETPLILKYLGQEYLLFDDRGVGVTFQLNNQQQLVHFTLKLITQPHCVPKWADEEVVFYQSGRIYRFKDQLAYDYPYHILCADKSERKYAILNKLHKVIKLHVFELEKIDKWKENDQIDEDEIFIELKFIVNDKLPTDNLKQSSLSIKFLDSNSIFVTSKQGEIYLISLKESTKQLKLDANVVIDKHYTKIPQEIHIKGIYLFKQHLDQFYTVGLDRRLFSFRIEEGQIADHYKMVCLAGKVNKLQIGREKNLVYFHDQTLKSLDLSKNQYPVYVNEFWKINDFTNFYISPFKEGIILIVKEQKIELVDIYKEQILDKIVCEDPISKIEWLNKKQAIQIMQLFNVIEETSDEVKPHQIDDFLLIIMLTGRIQLIDLRTGQKIINTLIQQQINIQQFAKEDELVTIKMNSIQVLFHNEVCNIFFVYNNCHVLFYTKDKIDSKQIHNQDILSLDVSVHNNNIYLITGCYNQTVSINVVKGSIILLGYLKHRFPIEKAKLAHGMITAIAKSHQSLQIWDVKQILYEMIPTRQTLEGLEKANIRGHCGFLLDFCYYSNNLIITSSEDQTIKVFDINHILNKHPPNKKKNKKKVKIQD